MKHRRLIAAAGVLAALIAVKFLLPGAAAAVRQRTAELLTLDRDYTAVFRELGERLSFSRRGGEPDDSSARETPAPQAATAVQISYHVEEAAVLGEFPPEQPELPAAVTAFLESQSAYLTDYTLPGNVDYGYTELPFDSAAPVAGYESSGFGYRVHPILNEVKFHYGTDLAAGAGENILAFADGTVTFAGPSDTFGNYLVIDHGDGWTSLYAHCSYLYAQAGQTVAAGEKIALVGATGLVTGPHLHFELQHEGIYINPEYYINSAAG